MILLKKNKAIGIKKKHSLEMYRVDLNLEGTRGLRYAITIYLYTRTVTFEEITIDNLMRYNSESSLKIGKLIRKRMNNLDSAKIGNGRRWCIYILNLI